jgi:hypothetical protein
MSKIRVKASKFMALCLAVTVILSLFSVAYADGVGDNDNAHSGGSSSTSSGVVGATWSSRQSGYRFQIVDKDFKPVSNVVDIVFSMPSTDENFGNDIYYNTRVNRIKSI